MPRNSRLSDIILRLIFTLVFIAGWIARAPAEDAPTLEIDWAKSEGRWSTDRANEWYARHAWINGANFVPSTASNQFEMWQADTFDPQTLDRELGWAAAVGFNTMRVFLHDMIWNEDAEGFEARIGEYLQIADKHGIKTMFVLFDSVWNPFPKTGPQDEPVPGVHNSRWCQGPHVDVLKDPARHDEVKPYVMAVLGRLKDDRRVLCWDLYNEPGNFAANYKEGWTAADKEAAQLVFLEKLFAWAREVNPAQPLTAGPWVNVGGRKPVHPLDKLMLEHSDIITFHSYSPLEGVKRSVEYLKQSGRPVICTEYMARSAGSTFKVVMPYLKETDVGAIHWGLVEGRSQTIYPWHSWAAPFTHEPQPWFHDVFRKDGTPYDESEIRLIRSLNGLNP